MYDIYVIQISVITKYNYNFLNKEGVNNRQTLVTMKNQDIILNKNSCF
jgi:hypothetical protein